MKKKNLLLFFGILFAVISVFLIIYAILLYNRLNNSIKNSIIIATAINQECDSDDLCTVTYKYSIDDKEYDKQLNGYRSYIEEKTHKKVSCFLYSILDEEIREVKHD